jgi:alkylation response protein AidB-like acyl-CoA dehydrogenase
MAHPYRLDEAAQQIVNKATAIAADVAGKHAADVDAKARYPKEAMDALAKEGLWGLCVPPALGGLGQAPSTFAAVVEELATACGSTAMIYTMHVTAAQAIASSGRLARKDEVLRAVAAGRHLTTLAFSEKGSRSQFWAPVSKLAAKDGAGWVTNAMKSWVTAAEEADSYVSSAQKPGAASPLESVVYLVDKKASGVRMGPSFEGLGLRGNDSRPVTLEGVAVAPEDLISALGEGAKTMLEVVLPWFVVGSAAMANGLARAAIGATAGHLAGTGFEHDGTKLRDLPGLRARLAEMSARTDASRAMLGYTTAEMLAPNAMTPLYVLQSRLTALETAVDVTDLAMKTCGGAAFSKHLPVERIFRDARAGWVMAPTVDHLKDFIGKALTGLPLF